MTNLLEETREAITDIKKFPEDDVVWVGTRNGKYAITWNDFVKIANVEYDSGYGGVYVPLELVIVFRDNSWLERYEYDGAESWTYCSTPLLQADSKRFSVVCKPDETHTSIASLASGKSWWDYEERDEDAD